MVTRWWAAGSFEHVLMIVLPCLDVSMILCWWLSEHLLMIHDAMLMIVWPSADGSMMLCWWLSDHLLMIPWCCTDGSCDKVRDNLSDCWDLLKFKYLHCMYVRSLTRLMRIKVFYMLKMNTLIDVSSFSWYRISSPKSYYCYLDWEKTVG